MTERRAGRVLVEGLEAIGHHGAYEEERREGRRFRVDLAADLDPCAGFVTDRLEDTVDYRHLAEAAIAVIGGPPTLLIERLAERIAEACLAVPGIAAVEVRVRKEATGVPGHPRFLGIEVRRSRP